MHCRDTSSLYSIFDILSTEHRQGEIYRVANRSYLVVFARILNLLLLYGMPHIQINSLCLQRLQIEMSFVHLLVLGRSSINTDWGINFLISQCKQKPSMTIKSKCNRCAFRFLRLCCWNKVLFSPCSIF